MNNSYSVIRAIRGPIALITLGVLFAVQNFTRFGFDQTWPVLLIVFGLLTLLQRGARPPAPPPQRPPFTGSGTGYTTTGYAQSPYAQPPVTPASGPAKGGFGTTAPPRSSDPGASTSSPEGGSV